MTHARVDELRDVRGLCRPVWDGILEVDPDLAGLGDWLQQGADDDTLAAELVVRLKNAGQHVCGPVMQPEFQFRAQVCALPDARRWTDPVAAAASVDAEGVYFLDLEKRYGRRSAVRLDPAAEMPSVAKLSNLRVLRLPWNAYLDSLHFDPAALPDLRYFDVSGWEGEEAPPVDGFGRLEVLEYFASSLEQVPEVLSRLPATMRLVHMQDNYLREAEYHRLRAMMPTGCRLWGWCEELTEQVDAIGDLPPGERLVTLQRFFGWCPASDESDHPHILADTLRELGRPGEAIALLEEGTRDNPWNSANWYELARHQSIAGQRERMLENLERAILLSPANDADAREDVDFKPHWGDAEFKALTTYDVGTLRPHDLELRLGEERRGHDPVLPELQVTADSIQDLLKAVRHRRFANNGPILVRFLAHLSALECQEADSDYRRLLDHWHPEVRLQAALALDARLGGPVGVSLRKPGEPLAPLVERLAVAT